MSAPAPLHLLPREQFPLTIRIYSRTGVLLWERVVEEPSPTEPVKIPGYGKTEHVPVSVRVTFADGTVYESGPEN